MCISQLITNRMQSTFPYIKNKILSSLFFLCCLLLCNLSFADPATDPLAASVKPQVQALFGAGSTVAYCIYVAEIVLGSVVYIKNKNPMTFIGVPLLVIFTHVMFAFIGS